MIDGQFHAHQAVIKHLADRLSIHQADCLDCPMVAHFTLCIVLNYATVIELTLIPRYKNSYIHCHELLSTHNLSFGVLYHLQVHSTVANRKV